MITVNEQYQKLLKPLLSLIDRKFVTLFLYIGGIMRIGVIAHIRLLSVIKKNQ